MRETAELRAIRESVLRVRMGDWLQIPKEVDWLDSILKEFVRALKKQWENDGAAAGVNGDQSDNSVEDSGAVYLY